MIKRLTPPANRVLPAFTRHFLESKIQDLAKLPEREQANILLQRLSELESSYLELQHNRLPGIGARISVALQIRSLRKKLAHLTRTPLGSLRL